MFWAFLFSILCFTIDEIFSIGLTSGLSDGQSSHIVVDELFSNIPSIFRIIILL
jgi:hypothetical protein